MDTDPKELRKDRGSPGGGTRFTGGICTARVGIVRGLRRICETAGARVVPARSGPARLGTSSSTGSPSASGAAATGDRSRSVSAAASPRCAPLCPSVVSLSLDRIQLPDLGSNPEMGRGGVRRSCPCQVFILAGWETCDTADLEVCAMSQPLPETTAPRRGRSVFGW